MKRKKTIKGSNIQKYKANCKDKKIFFKTFEEFICIYELLYWLYMSS